MKLTIWGTPRVRNPNAGDNAVGAGWQCSRCSNRRMLGQRYCRACHAAYERLKRRFTKEFAL